MTLKQEETTGSEGKDASPCPLVDSSLAEVAALREQRALEERLTKEEREDILKTIEEQFVDNVPTWIRKAILIGLRGIHNDRLCEFVHRP